METRYLGVRIPATQYKELEYYASLFKMSKTDLVIQALGTLFPYLQREREVSKEYLKERGAGYATDGMA